MISSSGAPAPCSVCAPCRCTQLGADEVIDYTKAKFDEVLKGAPVDAVIDLVGGARLVGEGGA